MIVFCIIWIAVMVIDNFLPFILSEFYPGYRHKTAALSVLGCKQSPPAVKWTYNIWCIVSGVVFCISGYAVYTAYGSGLSIALWCILALYGFGCEILSGIFSVNENKEQKSVASQIHGAGSAIGFTLLVFAPLLLGVQAFQIQNIVLGIISTVCFAAAFACFAIFAMGEKDAFKNTVLSYGGLWQRAVLALTYIPLLVFLYSGCNLTETRQV